MSRKLLMLLAAAALLMTGCDALRIRVDLNRGHRLYRAQRYEEALTEYKKILDIDPNHYIALYQVAMSNLAMYHPGSTHPKDTQVCNDSIAAFEKLLNLTPPSQDTGDKVEKYYLSLLSAAGRNDKAVTFLESQVKKNPNDPKMRAELGSYYAKAGDFPKELASFEEAARLEPTNKTRWYTVGVDCWARCYKGGAAVSDAEREQLIAKGHVALDKALAIDPDYFDALVYQNLLHREMAKVLANRNDLEAAQEEVKKADALAERAKAAKKKEQMKAGGR